MFCSFVLNGTVQDRRYPVAGQINEKSGGSIIFCATARANIKIYFYSSASPSEAAPYEILLGGWKNTKSAIRKNDAEVVIVDSAFDADAKLDSEFGDGTWFWVQYWRGCISVGKGELGAHIIMEWRDVTPIQGIDSVAFGVWKEDIRLDSVCLAGSVPTTLYLNETSHLPAFGNFSGYDSTELSTAFLLGSRDFADLSIKVIDSSAKGTWTDDIPLHSAILYPYIDELIDVNKAEDFVTKWIDLVHEKIQLYYEAKDIDRGRRMGHKRRQSGSNTYAKIPQLPVKKNIIGHVLAYIYGDQRMDLSQEEIEPCMECAQMFGMTSLAGGLKELLAVSRQGAARNGVVSHDATALRSFKSWRFPMSTPDRPTFNITTVYGGGNMRRYRLSTNWKSLDRHLKVMEVFPTDMVITAHNECIGAHRAVFANESSVVHAMMSGDMIEAKEQEMNVSEATGDVIEVFLRILYSSLDVKVVNNIPDIETALSCLRLTDKYLMMRMRGLVSEYIATKLLNTKTVTGVLAWAKRLRCPVLYSRAMLYLKNNFQDVSLEEAFKELGYKELLNVIKYDDLAVVDENALYDSVMLWLKAQNPDFERDESDKITALLSCIRFPSMSMTKLEKHLLDRNIYEVEREFILEAQGVIAERAAARARGQLSSSPTALAVSPISLAVMDTHGNAVQAMQAAPSSTPNTMNTSDEDLLSEVRGTRPPTFTGQRIELKPPAAGGHMRSRLRTFARQDRPAANDGKTIVRAPPAPGTKITTNDTLNGIVYALATNLNTSDWIDPHNHGRVTVKLTAPEGPFVKAANFVSKNARVRNALPGRTAAVTLDLGPKCSANVTHYALRHDSENAGFLRHWCFEASNDGQEWTLMREHRDDESVNYAGQTVVFRTHATLAMKAPSSGGSPGSPLSLGATQPAAYFRMFRVRLLGPNNDGSFAIHCSTIELFGTYRSEVMIKS
eukprot:Clim_evm42s128 gene=Clim_evmTU42s128